RQDRPTVVQQLDGASNEVIRALVVFALLEEQPPAGQLAKRGFAGERVQVVSLHAVKRRKRPQQAKIDRLAFHGSPGEGRRSRAPRHLHSAGWWQAGATQAVR